MTRILIAGMGNVLRRDDGFGVAVAQRLMQQTQWPAAIKVIEVGIGGIHLVQELMAGYDVLIVIDAMERAAAAGTVHVLEVDVPDLSDWPERAREDFLADMHYATPAKALILARALGVLPARTFLVGCQPAEVNELGIGLSSTVEDAISPTLEAIAGLLDSLDSSRPSAGDG